MGKKFALLLLLIFFNLLSINFVYAQEEETGPSVIMSDLGVPYTMECVKVTGVDSGWPPKVDNVTFTGTCSSPNGCVIGVCGPGCLESKTNENGGLNCTKTSEKVCTVYDPELNQRYFGENAGGLPDVTVNGAHQFPPGAFTVQGSIRNPGDHVWYDIYAVSEPDLGGGGSEGDDPSQQLGTTKFVFEGSKEICKSVFWDPYGRVFDAVSLEPLGDNQARVTLLDDKDQYVDVPSNNAPIDNLGKYNIFIKEDGMYKLKVTDMVSHEFVAVEPNPKYTDLYERIYRFGDPAFEEKQSDPERYDIPVKPKGTPLKREVETIFKDQNVVWLNGDEYAKIQFRVSHPLTKIETNIEGGVPCEETDSDYTDKEGFCTMTFVAGATPQDGVKITKIKNADYYLSYEKSLIKDFVAGLFSLVSKDVSAQQRIRIEMPQAPAPVMASDDITFEPILRHIEGYVYNDKGQVIPKAKIQIVLTMNNKLFYETTADDSGFFTIYKKNLPPLEYHLKIIDPSTSKSADQTTSVFVKKNQTYIDSEKINLMSGTKNNQPIVNPATGKLNEIVKVSPTPRQEVAASKGSAINLKILSVFVILFVLVASMVGVIIYIKQSRPQI